MKLQPNLYMILLLCTSSFTYARQLKLGENPSVIQKSALLELDSKSQGLLLPRISDTSLATIKSAPDGMLIFLTTSNSLCVRANGAWRATDGAALLKTTNVAGLYAVTSAAGVQTLNIPNATATVSGFMSTGAQTFAGSKIFNGAVIANGSFILNHGMTSTDGAVNIITAASQPIQLISGDVTSVYGTSVLIGSNVGTTITQDVYLPHIQVDDTKDSVLLIDQGRVWKKKLGGLSAATLPLRVVTTGTVVTDEDYTVIRSGTASGIVTITLPEATGRSGRTFIIKRAAGSAGVTVNASGSSFEGDDNNSGFDLGNGQSATLQSDGTYWYIISISSPL
jgi:hypothetical protein